MTRQLLSTCGQVPFSLKGNLIGGLVRRLGGSSALSSSNIVFTQVQEFWSFLLEDYLFIFPAEECRDEGGLLKLLVAQRLKTSEMSVCQGLAQFNQPDGIINAFLVDKDLIGLLSLPPGVEDRENELPGNYKPRQSE